MTINLTFDKLSMEERVGLINMCHIELVFLELGHASSIVLTLRSFMYVLYLLSLVSYSYHALRMNPTSDQHTR